MATKAKFKGNKSYLDSKYCQQCGHEMVWRKAWAKNWQQIKYCSDACRNASKLSSKIYTDVESI